jgi:hypothetical protein
MLLLLQVLRTVNYFRYNNYMYSPRGKPLRGRTLHGPFKEVRLYTKNEGLKFWATNISKIYILGDATSCCFKVRVHLSSDSTVYGRGQLPKHTKANVIKANIEKHLINNLLLYNMSARLV